MSVDGMAGLRSELCVFLFTCMSANFEICSSQAVTIELVEIDLEQDNLPDALHSSLFANINPCEYHYPLNEDLDYEFHNTFLVLHLNISSLHAHFDDLNEFLSKFSHPPSIIFLTETRIYSNPTINVNIPGYTFFHKPTPTKAGKVGAYVSNNLEFSENETLNLDIEGCEDLWLEVKLQRQRPKHIFAVVYRHPCNNKNTFFESMDKKLQTLNRKSTKALLMGDINIDLSTNTTLTSDYMHLLHSNAFCNLITKPTQVTSTTQTIIDHSLTNDNESIMIPGVLSYKISDHYPFYCAIKNINNNKLTNAFNKYSFRNTKNIDGNDFRNDLETALAPLLFNLMSTSVSQKTLDEHFNELLSAISYVIDKHTPVQTASR